MALTLDKVDCERGRRAFGGFSDIYKGQCFGEEVALKVLNLPLPLHVDSPNSLGSSEGCTREHLSEILIWRQLSHPNILPFYGIHFLDTIVETRLCFVCPWMENGNVVQFLDRRNPETDVTDCVSLVSKNLRSPVFYSTCSLF
jgi:hypothetical protein